MSITWSENLGEFTRIAICFANQALFLILNFTPILPSKAKQIKTKIISFLNFILLLLGRPTQVGIQIY